ncbi:MAG TPA: hypothetical protein VMM14_07960 [Acidimicrobiia bacterium]|nr:hypothetical protein [Acidimicrobiia bacterium]
MRLRILAGTLGVIALVELVLLRSGTRTLVHIPGLGRYEVSIGVLNEVGRLAYYLSMVLLVATLGYLAVWLWRADTSLSRAAGFLVALFILVAAAGRLGILAPPAVGWYSMAAITGMVAISWRGVRSIPLALFVGSWVAAAWSVLGQGSGGGISVRSVDTSVIIAEALLILAGVTAPLLVSRRVTTTGLAAGFAAFLVVAAGFSVGGSTLAILTLWNLGVPGWFSPLAFGLAFGGLVIATWSALVAGERMTAASIGLLVAGGVGMISTYQTGLVLAALTISYAATLAEGRTRIRSSRNGDPEPALTRSRETSLSGVAGR